MAIQIDPASFYAFPDGRPRGASRIADDGGDVKCNDLIHATPCVPGCAGDGFRENVPINGRRMYIFGTVGVMTQSTAKKVDKKQTRIRGIEPRAAVYRERRQC